MRALALHGFLGRGADWNAFGQTVDLPRLTFDAPDLPGHGPVPRPVPGHFAAWVLWVTERLRLATAPVHLLGYSMGGRLALAAALAEARRGRVASLTLLGASPGIAGADNRAARAAVDGERADALVADGLTPFLEHWYRQPLFAPARAAVGHQTLIAARRDGRADALASALRTAGAGVMPNLRPGLGALRVPVLVLAGVDDPKFCALGREIADAAPRALFTAVPDAGHALLVEAPARCAALWGEFIHANANPEDRSP